MGLIFNGKEIWEGNSSGEVLYQIPSGYDGFFVSARYGDAPDIGKYKAINGSDTINLSKSITDCDNGILVHLSQQAVSWITDNYSSSSLYTPTPPVSPLTMVIKKDSPSASMTYGFYVNGTAHASGNIKVSGNKMTFETDDTAGMGILLNGDRVIFWVITSIVSY